MVEVEVVKESEKVGGVVVGIVVMGKLIVDVELASFVVKLVVVELIFEFVKMEILELAGLCSI